MQRTWSTGQNCIGPKISFSLIIYSDQACNTIAIKDHTFKGLYKN